MRTRQVPFTYSSGSTRHPDHSPTGGSLTVPRKAESATVSRPVKPPQAAERLVWAVETLAVQPTDRLLEIGCGHGVAVSLVCEKLDGGSITAIDRSPTMIAMARQRNAACVAAGSVSLQGVSLHAADFGAARFDKVFAIRVGVFWRGEPARELAVVKRCLAPEGRLYLVDDPPAANQARNLIQQASVTLENHGFTIQEVLTHALGPTTVVCVIAGSTERPVHFTGGC